MSEAPPPGPANVDRGASPLGPANARDPEMGPFPPEFPGLVDALGRKLVNLGGFLVLVCLVAGFLLVSDLLRGRFPLGPWYAAGAGAFLVLVVVHAGWMVRAGLALRRARARLRAVGGVTEALRDLDRLFTLSEVAIVLFVLGGLIWRVVSWFTG